MCCNKTSDENLRVEIVDNEEPMATEEDVSYEDLPADAYATIEESNMMKTDDDAENVYHGEVDVTAYKNYVVYGTSTCWLMMFLTLLSDVAK